MQAFTQGIMKRTDLTDAQKATEINNYKNQYGITNEQLASAAGYTVQQVNDFLSPKAATTPTQSAGPTAWTAMTDGTTGLFAKEYGRLFAKGLTDSEIRSLAEQVGILIGQNQWNQIGTAGKALVANSVTTPAAPPATTPAAKSATVIVKIKIDDNAAIHN